MTHNVVQGSLSPPAREPPSEGRALLVDRTVLAMSTFLSVYLAAATIIAVVGVYRPVFVLIGAIAPAVSLSWVVARRHETVVLRLPSLVPTVVILGVIAAVAVANVVFAGEHLLTDRDPGVYLNTARWIAVHGNLLIDGVTGPFEGISGLTADWTGFYESRPDGLLYPQFLHVFPSGIASLMWIFGDAALRMVNALFMALGLAFVYLLTAQVAKPWFASIAVAASSVSVVSWYFARDVYTEPLVLLLLTLTVASLWIGYMSRTIMPGIIAALTMGVTAGVRIDAWLLIGGFAVVVALIYLRRIADGTQNPDSVILLMATPYVLGVFGLIEGVLRSPSYLEGRLGQVQLMLLMAVMALIVGFAIVASPRWRRFADVWKRIGTSYGRVRWVLVAAVVLFGSYLAFIRPLSQAMGSENYLFIAEIAAKEGLLSDGLRTMTELTLRWFTWYWGWVGLLAVAAGVILVILRAGSKRTVTEVAFTIAAPMLVAFLLRPSIAGDQPWAMRRFLAPALLMIPLLTATTLDALWSWGSELSAGWRTLRRAVTVGIAVAVFAVPLWVSFPILDVSHQQGMVATTAKLCASLPENAAVVVSGAPLDTQFGATIRTFCDVPTVATVDALTPETMIDLAAVLGGRGVQPIFVRTSATIPEGWQIVESDVAQYSLVQATATKAPDSVKVVDFRWWASTPRNEGP